MRIDRLKLVGYKPLMWNNIQSLELTTTSIYQLILGTNGSGKTQVMSQLSPVPPVKGDYQSDGRKELDFQHKGHHYHMVSTFKGGGKHTLSEDGTLLHEEINGSMMEDVIKEMFGLTQKLFELLAGITPFTSLSPQKRREWLTKLCDTDFTFALNFHQQMKSQLRDSVGVVKYTEGRVVDETNTLKGYGDIASQEQHYQQLHHELNELFQSTRQDLPSADQVSRSLQDSENKITHLSQWVLNNPAPYVPATEIYHKVYQSFDDVRGDLEFLKEAISVDTSLQERISQELSDLEGLLQGVAEKGVESLDELYARRSSNQSRVEEISRQQQVFDVTIEPDQARATLINIEEDIRHLLTSLPDNSERRYSRERLQQDTTERQRLIQERETLSNQASHKQGHLNHLNSQELIHCPKCQHTFKVGLTDQVVGDLESALHHLQHQVNRLDQRIKTLDEEIDEIREYSNTYQGVKRLVTTYPVLKPLWDELTERQSFTHQPVTHTGLITTFYNDVTLSCEKQRLLRENEDITGLVQSMEKQRSSDGFVSRRDKLQQQLEETMARLRTQRDQFTSLKEYAKLVNQCLNVEKELDELMQDWQSQQSQYVMALRNDAYQQVIKQHQIQLAGLENSRQSSQSTQGILKDLEEQLIKVKQDREILAAIEKTLSPATGLIAEQLSGFIGGFTTHVNEVIKLIWTYDLIVHPCGLDTDEQLDYKFPLTFRGQSDGVKDIAMGSQAQRDVINLAIRLVAMVYLKMEDFPLYLDEVGASFDDQHRVNLMQTIKGLVDTNNYTQMFMINHYATQFGVFTNADVCVLDDQNISVPGHYNEHVTMG